MAASLLGVPAAAAERSGERLTPQTTKIDKHGGEVAGKGRPANRLKNAPLPAVAWPRAATAQVDLNATGVARAAGRGAKVGDLPVWVERAVGKAGERLAKVDVKIHDRAALPEALRDGLVLEVGTPAGEAAGTAKVSVDYASFRYAAGGDWASRLRLWQLPACALTTPDKAGCHATALPTVNDTAAGVATAEVVAPSADAVATSQDMAQLASEAPVARAAQGAVLMLAAAASGASGDFTATSLAPTSTWAAGGSSGDFSWSYPLRMPPGAGGPTPQIELNYSSGSVDGRSPATNNQPSWVGEGFEYAPGSIERRYVPCSEDMKNGANNTVKTADLCWKSDNATMSLNGRGGELIFETGKGWHSRNEDGAKIEKLTGGANGDNDGEYWKVTTTDGTQYFFGMHSLPGQTARTNSALTVPVFGNHTGEPCRQSSFAASNCVQVYRWNLDYVVDPHGNTMSYWYDKETNQYARNISDADNVTYDRAGVLKRIDYGTYNRTTAEHGVTESSIAPVAQVVFTAADRCVTSCWSGTDPVKANWPDTPWDQNCKSDATECPQQYAPTFWTTKRLSKIVTRVWDTTKTTAAWQDVESWTLTHAFPSPGDGTNAGLWLDSLTQTGLVGGTAAMPPITFTPVSLPNRVLTQQGATNSWQRISDIVTETGARTHVDYSLPECTDANTASLVPHTNTKRCYPVLVEDPDNAGAKKTEWWHKYRVDHIAESDVVLAGGHEQPTKHTYYEYPNAPAWHYADDDGLTKPDFKTWSQFRGYDVVKTRVGETGSPQTLTVTTFLRGMHGDRLNPSGGTRSVVVAAALGSETVYDEEQFAGTVREQTVYNGVESKPVSRTVNVPWRSNALASRTINGDVAEARFVKTKTSYKAAALGVDGGRGWRVSRTELDFDHAFGTVNWSRDDGDVAVGGDEKCTVYTYNRNAAKNITTTVRRAFTTARPCDQAPTSSDQVITDVRSYYDGAASDTTVPVYGDVTRVDQLKDWTSAGGTQWQTASQATFDKSGRQVTVTDGKGSTTTTAFTPAVGGPVTKVTTTSAAPFSWVTTVEQNPYWGSAVKTTDPNSRVTDVDYDPLGRATKVWDAGWTKAAHATTPKQEISHVFATGRDTYPYTVVKTLNANAKYMTTYQIYDGLLRKRQTQIAGGDGVGRVVTDTIFDQWGRAATSYAGHAEPGAPSGTLWWEPEWSVPAVSRTEYDRASRVTAEVFLSGDEVVNLEEQWRTVTAHEGDMVMSTPPTGAMPTTTIIDTAGRTVAIRQHTTPAGVGGSYDETRYVYDGKQQLAKVVDAAGNEWTYKYDVRGRQTESVDPDRGKTTREFNDYNELVKVTEANNEVLWYVYDALGRRTQVRDDSASGTLRAEYKYDRLYTGQTVRGQLTEAIRYEPAGSANAYKWRVGAFNQRYQPTAVNVVVPTSETDLNGTYSYAYGFADADGAPVSVGYPAVGALPAETITTHYDDATGQDVRANTSWGMADTTILTRQYNAYGQEVMTTRKQPGGLYVEDTVSYEPDTHRVKTTSVKPENAVGTVSKREYDYDDGGNIISITQNPQVGSAETQCFRYNESIRLSSAWTPKAGVDCDGAQTVANLGGPAPYWQDWTFDKVGNRLSETTHTVGGDTVRTSTFPVGGAGVARPHAPSQAILQEPGQAAVTTAYGYDNSGNMVCRPNAKTANTCPSGSASQSVTWDAEGKLSAVTVGGQSVETSVYDADGARLVRRDAAGKTLYLPGQDVRREGGVSSATRYYTFGEDLVASRTSAGLTWLYSDHQGTQQVAVDAATLAVTIRQQTPYGGTRPGSSIPSWPNGRGYVGGVTDPTGLVHIGAREYDPALGIFISVDPIMDLADPHQWNAYSYSHGSPVTFSDSTGLRDCDFNSCDSFGNNTESGPDWQKPSGGKVGGGRLSEKEYDRKVKEWGAWRDRGKRATLLRSATDLGGGLIIAPSPRALEDALEAAYGDVCDWKILCYRDDPWVMGVMHNELCADNPDWCSGEIVPVALENGVGSALVKALARSSLPKALMKTAAKDTHVYMGYLDDGTTWVYSGIAKDVGKRTLQHLKDGRPFIPRQITTSAVTRGEARAIEQALIVRNQGLNKINSISPKHDYYEKAVEWGEAWLKANGI
ncbi:RHS repeat-associated core domain-containing protein [Catellatospora chokoriensis]|nr:RHS repeat-associated core domain-containing protein [Catellatospora chokoriensis]